MNISKSTLQIYIHKAHFKTQQKSIRRLFYKNHLKCPQSASTYGALSYAHICATFRCHCHSPGFLEWDSGSSADGNCCGSLASAVHRGESTADCLRLWMPPFAGRHGLPDALRRGLDPRV